MNRCAALATLAATVAISCGDGSPTEPEPVQDTLVFTRADQSRISFATGALLYAWCGPWEEGVVATPSLQVLFGGPGPSQPRWHLRAVVADVEVGQAMPFPNTYIWDEPSGVDIFVFDPPNELSTQQSGSGGTITFQQLQCGSGGKVQFTIDATIASEFGDGPAVTVKGSFRAPVGQAPGF